MIADTVAWCLSVELVAVPLRSVAFGEGAVSRCLPPFGEKPLNLTIRFRQAQEVLRRTRHHAHASKFGQDVYDSKNAINTTFASLGPAATARTGWEGLKRSTSNQLETTAGEPFHPVTTVAGGSRNGTPSPKPGRALAGFGNRSGDRQERQRSIHVVRH